MHLIFFSLLALYFKNMSSLVVKSPAKLNLYLNVQGRRQDGYHEIETVFERIDLCDEIKFSEIQKGEVELLSNSAEVPLNHHSLVYNCVELLKKETNSPGGIAITIDKRIPIASGLGGGSSNAASIILGLNKLWRLNLTKRKLLNIGRRLGADVSFFLYDEPLGAGFGRGDRILPLPKPEKALWHILVVPDEQISSQEAYSLPRPFYIGCNRRQKERGKKDRRGLTERKFGIKMVTCALKKGDLALLRSNLYNSLEEAVGMSYPVIREVRRALESLGQKFTLMSGSGPAVFGLTDTRKEAVRLKRELDSKHKGWKTFVVSTY